VTLWLLAAAALAASAALVAAGGTSPRAAASTLARTSTAASKPGTWSALWTTPAPQAGVPAVWEGPDHRAWVLWGWEKSSQYTYEYAVLGANGGVAVKPADVFAGQHWGSLSGTPAFVSDGAKPILIFSGIRASGPYSNGCIVGALPGKPRWQLQSWSLSNNCLNPVNGGAAVGPVGEVAAAWPGGKGVLYRIGSSPTIPATGSDSGFDLRGAHAANAAVVSDLAGNGSFYVAWSRYFSPVTAQDGYYVKDVTSGGPIAKAPGSGTNSVNHEPEFVNLPIVSTNSHHGVFLAYDSDGPSAWSLRLWRVGSPKALTVPGSTSAYAPAISAGPDGRLWLAWYNEQTNKVSVVRTDKADTRFGQVTVYSTPCFEHGLVGLSAGNWGRLDIAMQCVNTSKLAVEEYATQSLVALSLTPGSSTIKNTTANKLTFKVTDVGDPVSEATVTVDGKSAKTGSSGTATISFPKGAKTGSFAVTAAAFNYLAAHGTLHIVK